MMCAMLASRSSSIASAPCFAQKEIKRLISSRRAVTAADKGSLQTKEALLEGTQLLIQPSLFYIKTYLQNSGFNGLQSGRERDLFSLLLPSVFPLKLIWLYLLPKPFLGTAFCSPGPSKSHTKNPPFRVPAHIAPCLGSQFHLPKNTLSEL